MLFAYHRVFHKLNAILKRVVFRDTLNALRFAQKRLVAKNALDFLGYRTTKHAITAEEAREFFFAPLPPTKQTEPLSELGQDVAKLVLCLAGINTIDLFGLQKSDYKKGVIGYKRAKTRSTRRDEAYFEIQVEPILYPLMEKYKTAPNDPYLFNFHKRFCDADSFNANVNTGIKQICKSMGLPKETWYSVYTFRYTWATVAQNDCAANIAEVGFGMNHSGSHTVTRGYIMLDFSPAWELNAKVIDFIFFSIRALNVSKFQ